MKKPILTTTLVLVLAHASAAQNTNSSSAPPATRSRQTAPARPADADGRAAPQGGARPVAEKPDKPAGRAAAQGRAATPAEAAQRRAVEDAFNSLVDGIRRADAAAVMKVYRNSPRLTLFNNNGTVTKSWEQARLNREAIYAKVRDVKLDVRDVQVELLGRDGAVVTALWDQSQTADGRPEQATGRMTLVFARAAGGWRIVHAHSSPDRPDPSRLLPSERPAEAAKP